MSSITDCRSGKVLVRRSFPGLLADGHEHVPLVHALYVGMRGQRLPAPTYPSENPPLCTRPATAVQPKDVEDCEQERDPGEVCMGGVRNV